MSFVHLHTHTEFSLLDGSNRIRDYIGKVVSDGQNAAAITDHGVMYGVIEFYKEAKKQGINPVIGCEIYVAPKSRFDREKSNDEDDSYYHLILLAENNTGYQNLVKIVSIGFRDGFYRKPRVDFETLQEYHEGLICLSACLAGQVQRLLQKNDYEGAKALAMQYQECFGKDNYFLELQDHGLPLDRIVISGLLKMHEETGIPVVCTNDCHYTEKSDMDAHDILLCIQTKKTVADEDRMRYPGGQYYVKSEEEMRELFSYIPEAIENTQKIADRCHVEIPLHQKLLPHYKVPQGYDSFSYLKKLCDEGLVKRYGDEAQKYRERLDFELKTIESMGYVDYFLIVWDFIHFAKTHGIPVGPGRGSAAGSIVSYVTEITNIDPMKYSLIFERFLNPERVSMPDIDVDIADDGRADVINYVTEKYGSDCVCQIVTFGTLAAKNAIRDVGRALNLPYAFVDKVAKEIPLRLPDRAVTIESSFDANPTLRSMYESDDSVKAIIDNAKKLEGLPRHASIHAAGVIITEEPIINIVPLTRVQAGGPLVEQFEKGTVEEIGLLKMDFLGLRTLTVIKDCLSMIKKNHGVDIDIDNIDFNDPAIYKMIGKGQTEGIFQLESEGMKNFMKDLKPGSVEDIIAGISLYRPGPMSFIPKYIAGRKNRDNVTYETEKLRPILENTYGCMVYQEQVMQIVRDLAGYSWGRSDLVRRAMAKKHEDEMARERQNFVYGNEAENVLGCIKNGIPEKVANHLFDEMMDFASYAFNKSHAAGYAVVGLQTAYLRAHYTEEFFAATMTSFLDRTEKVAEYISVVRDLGITVLPPDVNSGEGPFTAEDHKIRFGMYAIKSIGHGVIDAITEEREKSGPFRNLSDFLERVNGRDITKRSVENLIKAGALDCFEGNRRQKLSVYLEIMDEVADRKKGQVSGQITLFDIASDEQKKEFRVSLPDQDEFPKEILLSFEKEVLGIYISGHPLDDYKSLMKKNCTASSLDFMLPGGAESEENNDKDLRAAIEDKKIFTVGGIVVDKVSHFTKSNQQMAFVTIEDMTGTIEAIFFPKTFEKYKDMLGNDEKLLIRGRSSVEENKDAKILVEECVRFSDVPQVLWVNFRDKEEYGEREEKLLSILREHPGRDKAMIRLSGEKLVKRAFSDGSGVTVSEGLTEELKKEFSDENVFVSFDKVFG
ncbi:MAG: DNA polymerase III subunit alpha [Lachnospiraceae bacterium]|nr:DNA polymerase III subunit alpha [Lachnospiraceae bacterium]